MLSCIKGDIVMFGEKIKDMRIKKGLSQKELAHKAEMSQQAISNFERNVDTPKIATLQKIAAALEVPYTIFIEVERPPRLTGNHFPVPPASRITDIMVTLNETGQEKVIDYASDLSKIPEYQAAAAPDPEDREPPDKEKDPPV